MNENVASMPAPKKPSLYRRKFLINKSEQLKIAFYLAAVIATVIAVSSAMLYRMMGTSIEAVMFSSHIKMQSLGEAFIPILVKVNIAYFVAVMAISCGLVFFLIHKLNVALRRLHFDITRAGQLDLSRPGNFSRIKLTSGLQIAFNEMISSIEPNMAALATSSAKISKLTASDDINIADVKAEIKSIKDSLDRLSPR